MVRHYILFVFFFAITANTSCKKKDIPIQIKVYNLGVPGSVTINLIKRVKDVIALKPDLVIIMIGTNDSRGGGTIFSSYKSNLNSLVDIIKNNSAAVMLLTPPPTFASTAIKQRLQVVCNLIDTISIEKNCYFIDINTIFSQTIYSGVSVLADDGIHPNSYGQNLIAHAIFTYLKNKSINPKNIVCFGDSITYGVDAQKAYPNILQDLLN